MQIRKRRADPNNKVERFLSAAETQRLKRAVEDSPNRALREKLAALHDMAAKGGGHALTMTRSI